MRVVQEYRHLGAVIGPNSWINKEIAARVASAGAASAALAKTCFNKKGIPEHSRRCAAAACVHSRLLFLAGSWPKLRLGQFRKLGAAYCRPLRVVANVHRPPAPDSDLGRVSNGAVLDHLKVVPLEWALVFR